ncbi:MAG: hypothetical protein HKN14_05795 [Marinicaulis sp.]|nr:hypothetical protein [Marinicaulis sp.]NNL89767.1 hypothetical protein [Marinicaulis sp.]
MLLRRITEHIKTQNWTAVFLDFVIVVVGVFIGIQVANWNDARGDRTTELQYLSDLRRNLVEDRVEYSRTLETIVSRVGAINFALMQAHGEAPPSGIALPVGDLSNLVSSEISFPNAPAPRAEDYASLWATINFARIVDSKSGTYNALVGSGDIGLIRDQKLVGELHTYYRLSSGVSDVQRKFFSFGEDSMIGAGRRYGLSPFESVEASRLIALVRENAELAVYLRQERQKAALQSGLVAGMDRRAEQLVSMIDGDKQ